RGRAAAEQGPRRRRQPLRAADRRLQRHAAARRRRDRGRRPARGHRGPPGALVMCTIVVVHDPGRSLMVAANRAELLTRPSAPPQRFDGGFVAGVDLLAGGTWMGATARGAFAGLTNVRPVGGADRAKRSRGSIVAGVLAAADPAAFVRGLDLGD